MADNIFDQFAEEERAGQSAPARATSGGNVFDQFADEEGGAQQPALQGAEPGWWDTAQDMALSAGTGLARGAAELAMTPVTVKRMGEDAVDTLLTGGVNAGRRLLGYEPISDEELARRRDAVPNISAPAYAAQDAGRQLMDDTLYQPRTNAGRYTEKAAEFVPAALGGGSGLVGRGANALRYGVLPGLASQAGQDIGEQFGHPQVGGVVGALIGGGVGSLLQRPSTTAGNMVGAATANVTPDQWRQAADLMSTARQRGIPLTTAEAIQSVTGGSTRMGDILRLAESQGAGAETLAPFFAQRPGQIRQAGNALLDQISPAGASPSMQGVGAQQAAQGAMGVVRGRINDSSQPFYQAAETQRIPAAELQQLQALPGYGEALRAVRTNPQLNRYVDGLPDDSVGVLNEVMKQLRQSSDNAAGAFNPAANQQVAAGYGADAAAVGQIGRSISPEFGQALDMQAAGRSMALDPLDAGPLGQVARTADPMAQGAALLPRQPVAGTAGEVDLAARHLMTQDPAAARGITRQAIERDFNEATAPRGAGAPDEFGGARFANAIGANPERSRVAEALLRTVAPGTEQELSDLVDVMRATGTRQRKGSLTAFNKEALDEMKGGGVAGAAKAAVSPLATARDFLERQRLGKHTNILAALMTGDDALARVAALAERHSPNRGRAALIRALMQAGPAGYGAPALPVN